MYARSVSTSTVNVCNQRRRSDIRRVSPIPNSPSKSPKRQRRYRIQHVWPSSGLVHPLFTAGLRTAADPSLVDGGTKQINRYGCVRETFDRVRCFFLIRRSANVTRNRAYTRPKNIRVKRRQKNVRLYQWGNFIRRKVIITPVYLCLGRTFQIILVVTRITIGRNNNIPVYSLHSNRIYGARRFCAISRFSPFCDRNPRRNYA